MPVEFYRLVYHHILISLTAPVEISQKSTPLSPFYPPASAYRFSSPLSFFFPLCHPLFLPNLPLSLPSSPSLNTLIPFRPSPLFSLSPSSLSPYHPLFLFKSPTFSLSPFPSLSPLTPFFFNFHTIVQLQPLYNSSVCFVRSSTHTLRLYITHEIIFHIPV